jgi:hypothetical protein
VDVEREGGRDNITVRRNEYSGKERESGREDDNYYERERRQKIKKI